MLGIDRFELDGLLKDHGIFLEYSPEELAEEVETVQRLQLEMRPVQIEVKEETAIKFQAAAKALGLSLDDYLGKIADLISPPQEKWINVKDRLPENDAPVLVCGHERYVSTAEWGKEFGFSVDREEIFCAADITHWMPLPEPPSPKPTSEGEK